MLLKAERKRTQLEHEVNTLTNPRALLEQEQTVNTLDITQSFGSHTHNS